jgi:hypothetical protein
MSKQCTVTVIAWPALSDAQNVRDPFELLAYSGGKRRRR